VVFRAHPRRWEILNVRFEKENRDGVNTPWFGGNEADNFQAVISDQSNLKKDQERTDATQRFNQSGSL
jgi:hypothetical protein